MTSISFALLGAGLTFLTVVVWAMIGDTSRDADLRARIERSEGP